MKKAKTNDIMNYLLEKLDEKGFILYYLPAYTTSSRYIKLDFGVCKSIRIAGYRKI